MLKKVFKYLIGNASSTMSTTIPRNEPITRTRYKKKPNGDLEIIVDKGKSDGEILLDVVDRMTFRMGSGLVNEFKDKVKPKVGSVIYCGLMLNQVEHSGIYVGYNKIVHLNGDGRVEAVTPKQFLQRLNGVNFAANIYVSSKDGNAIGSRIVAQRARAKVGQQLEYRLFFNNCHKFSSSCLTGDRDNTDTMFSSLVQTMHSELGSNEWRMWDLPD